MTTQKKAFKQCVLRQEYILHMHFMCLISFSSWPVSVTPSCNPHSPDLSEYHLTVSGADILYVGDAGHCSEKVDNVWEVSKPGFHCRSRTQKSSYIPDCQRESRKHPPHRSSWWWLEHPRLSLHCSAASHWCLSALRSRHQLWRRKKELTQKLQVTYFTWLNCGELCCNLP